MAAIISSASPGSAGRSTSAASGGTAAKVVRAAGVAICHQATANGSRIWRLEPCSWGSLWVGLKACPSCTAGSTSRGSCLPFIGFVLAVVLLWNELVDWSDLAVMAIMYVLSGYGVTLGFHRLLTHRSFQTFKPVEYTLAVLGSMAVQGP